MRAVGSSTLRGGQTVFHGIRMWGQILRGALFVSACSVLAFPAWNVWRNTTAYDWYAAGMVTLAEAKLAIGYAEDSGQEVDRKDGTTHALTITEIAAAPGALAVRERLRDEVFESAFLGAKASAPAIALFLALFWYRGRQLNRAHRIRGAELVTARQLRRRVRPPHRRLTGLFPFSPKPYRIADVPYPERAEIVDPENPKTALSVRAMLTANLGALEYLPDTGRPFSIRDWISRECRAG